MHPIYVNPFLPSLATAMLACWPEAAARQLQKTDCLNLNGYYLPCGAHNVFKFRKQMKKLMVISTMRNLSLLSGYFSV